MRRSLVWGLIACIGAVGIGLIVADAPYHVGGVLLGFALYGVLRMSGVLGK